MEKRVFIILISLFFAITGFAQPPGFGQGQFNPEDMIKRQTEQMVNDLGLNAEQAVKAEALNKKYSEKMSQLFQSTGDDREQLREKMQQLNTDKNKELKGFLTEEQYKKHIELEQKRMEERRQNMGQRGPNQSERRGAPRGGGSQ